MVDVLPCPSASTSSSATSNPLVPLFQHAATAKDLGKTEMIVINALFPHVPATAIPDGLRSKLLADMDNLDGANLRSSILVHVLVRSAEVLKEEAIDAAILDPIMPLLVKDEPTTLLNLTRYLLPSLFSARPSTTRSLLDALSGYGNGEEAFSAWISVAALGVASGSIDTSDLPADDLRDAIAHADSSVQLRALQLLIGTKHLLRDDIMGLIKESIMANAVLSSAGCVSSSCSRSTADSEVRGQSSSRHCTPSSRKHEKCGKSLASRMPSIPACVSRTNSTAGSWSLSLTKAFSLPVAIRLFRLSWR
jgi:hypothetical protein